MMSLNQLSCLGVFLARSRTDVQIVLKVTFLFSPVRKNNLAVTVLDPPDPSADVAATIGPSHFSVTVALIFSVLALVHVA